MHDAKALDVQVARLGLWSVIVFIVTSVLSLLLPLDVPGGYLANHGERVTWLNENRELFILGLSLIHI